MIRYRLKWGLEVFLNASDTDQVAPIEYTGNSDLGSIVLNQIAQSYGAFGHLIGRQCTPPDLAAAMSSKRMEPYNPTLIEGESLTRAVVNIPDGALT